MVVIFCSVPLPKRTDKSKFDGGRPQVSPTDFAVTFLRFRFYWFRFLLRRGDLRSPASNTPINQNLKTGKRSPPQASTTQSRPKKNGPTKETPMIAVFAFGKYWARPLRRGNRHVRTHPMGYPKNLSQKGFCGAFSLKKRPPAPQRPRPQAPPARRPSHRQKSPRLPSGGCV